MANIGNDKTPSSRLDALNAAIKQIEKAFGKGAIMTGLNSKPDVNIPSISSGSLSLDLALGVGGYPRGRIIEIYGNESSGKTSLALHAIAKAQEEGGNAAIIDVEHALDLQYAQKLGVNVSSLILSQPDNAEQALEICDALVRSGSIDVLVLDSVAALVPKAEIEGEMGDSHMGLQARMMSQALRKLTAAVSQSKCVLIFINQIRMKIGVMFGNPETTTGGNALKFYASVRLEIRKSTAIKEGDNVIGNETKVKVVKNKVASPFRTAEFEIIYGEGISRTGELIDLGVKLGILDKSGAWISYKNEKIGQGRENAKRYLKANPKICTELEQAIKKALNSADFVAVSEKIQSVDLNAQDDSVAFPSSSLNLQGTVNESELIDKSTS